MKIEEIYNIFKEHPVVSKDTRDITEGCIYFALKGERFNGNEFCEEALKKGAAYAISDEREDDRIIKVNDVLTTLQELARHHRRVLKTKIIGITGSNGKTTTKELMLSILSTAYKTLATEGNLNNHIGVPLTLLRIHESHELAIIEMGANRPGDIEELCAIAEPDWGLITNIGKAHLEGFGSIETTLKTKAALYESVERKGGKIFLNADDPLLSKVSPRKNAIKYAVDYLHADIMGKVEKEHPFIQVSWNDDSYHSPTLETHLVGGYNIYNIIAGVAVGVALKMKHKDINDGIRSYIPQNNRSQVLKTEWNTLILDAYNANPASMHAAIESFASRKENKPFMILGDMFELGPDSAHEHQEVVSTVQEKKLPTFFIGKHFMKAKIQHDGFLYFNTTDDLKLHLKKQPLKGRVILLKGSRSMGLETLVEYI